MTKKETAGEMIVIKAMLLVIITFTLISCSDTGDDAQNARSDASNNTTSINENLNDEMIREVTANGGNYAAIRSQYTERNVPNKFHGVEATIKIIDSTCISDKPLLVEYSLRNTTEKPVVLHGLGYNTFPSVKIQGCDEVYLSGSVEKRHESIQQNITLESGKSIRRYFELRRGEKTKDFPFRIDVWCEDTKVLSWWRSKVIQKDIKFRIWFDDWLFITPREGDVSYVEPVLATPWLTIPLDKN